MAGARATVDFAAHGIRLGHLGCGIVFGGNSKLIWQRGQRAPAGGMQVKDVAGVSLATGRAAQQERDLAVSPGVLGQVVVNNQGVASGYMNSSPIAQPA